MRPFSQTLLLCFPALMALALLALSTLPVLAFGFSLTPNVAWVMGLVVVSLYAPAWPVSIAFVVGLLQDVSFATPLGAQALLAVVLVMLLRGPLTRATHMPFQLRWLQALAVLLALHALLWVVMALVQPFAPAWKPMLLAGLVSAAWFPLFYGVLARVLRALVPAGARR